jgi:hypothetical protein
MMTDYFKQIRPNFLIVTSMIFIASLIRLIPHPPNFTPIAAMALFGGAYFSKKQFAFIIPISAMIITDAVIGFHSLSWLVYLSFALIVLVGIIMLNKVTIKNVVIASLISSTSFFLITNFGVWLGSNFYQQNISGLIECYVAAIPFFSNNILGDLMYSGVLFGVYEWLKSVNPSLASSKV